MKTIKKILSILVIGALSLSALAGCTTTYKQDDVDRMIENAVSDANKAGYDSGLQVGAESVNVDEAVLTALNEYKNSEEVTTVANELDTAKGDLEKSDVEVERLKAVLEDYELAEQEIQEETLSLKGSEEIELNLGDNFGFKTYDDGDIAKLLDTEIRFDGTNYDIHEEIVTTNDLKLAYSLIDDEEFAENPYIITTDDGALTYKYVFEDSNEFVNDVDRDEPLTITFLGKEMVITSIDAGEFEVRVGSSNWLKIDETLIVGDNTFVLEAVTENGDSAGIRVNGELKWIDEGDDLELDGVTLAVEDVKVIHSDNNAASVKLTFADSNEVYQVFEDGDAVVYDEDEDDSEFVYKIDVAGNNVNYIAVEHNQKMDELDDDFLPLLQGESITFPNDYFALRFDSANVNDYNKITLEFDDVEDEAGNEFNGIIFTGDASDSFEIDSEETNEIYAWTTDNGLTWTLSYIDEDSDVVDTADTTFKVIFEDTTYDVSYDGNLAKIGLLDIDVALNGGEFTHLGINEEDAESTDVSYNLVDIGTRDSDVLGTDGIIIIDPEDNSDNDVVEFLVPEEELELTSYLG